ASHALALVGVPVRRVIRRVQEQRDARYGLLRGYFHGADDDNADEIDQARLGIFTLSSNARAIGQSLARLALPDLGVRVASLRRQSGKAAPVADDTLLMDGDTLLLSGKPTALALAIAKLQTG
ncbi:MAG: TrkA C-terminal domain-containing protein, partial [Variovorax sp.]